MSIVESQNAVPVCSLADLVAGSGVAVKIGNLQLAVFYLPDESPQVYVLDNYDPIGKANVISRGIVGDIKGDLVVASPLYKQHFRLTNGTCIEEDAVALGSYRADLVDNQVMVFL